jgi:hypothetical protein
MIFLIVRIQPQSFHLRINSQRRINSGSCFFADFLLGGHALLILTDNYEWEARVLVFPRIECARMEKMIDNSILKP